MDKNQVLRKLPKVAALLENEEIKRLLQIYNRNFIVSTLRESIEEIRSQLLDLIGTDNEANISQQELIQKVIANTKVKLKSPYSLKRVVNATGVLIHTNLGRAPLPNEAIQALISVAEGYSNLEYNLECGERGERYDHVRNLLCEITGAEDALVVNNNAAAVLLCLSALAAGKEVIISRGELVEIGGSFRIPDVMAQSGAKLVEVGTTNKTYSQDYQRAINENTALLMKVHTSNFRIVGFTSEVSNKEIKAIAEKNNLPVIEDLGSGVLINLESYGLPKEPMVQDSVKAGVDLITFSGDKLLGGPQAGLIVGKSKYITILKRHPLTRALRIDKLTLTALEAVLRLYQEKVYDKIPVISMLTTEEALLEEKALKLADSLKEIFADRAKIEVIEDTSQTGGGTLPTREIPTKAVAISYNGLTPEQIGEKFRKSPVPIIGRIRKEKFLLDMRTISEKDCLIILEMARNMV